MTESNAFDQEKVAIDCMAGMLNAQRQLFIAMRRLNELTSFSQSIDIESKRQSVALMHDQFKKVNEHVGQVNKNIQSLLEFRRGKDKEIQRASIGLDNMRQAIGEGLITLNITSDYIRECIVISRHALAETRKAADRSRAWAKLGSDLIHDFTIFQDNIEQLNHIIKNWRNYITKIFINITHFTIIQF